MQLRIFAYFMCFLVRALPKVLTAVFSYNFLVNDHATSFRWRYSLTTFNHKTIQQNFPRNIFIFWKIFIKEKYQAKLFCFLLAFSFGRFGIDKITSKLWMSVFRWKLWEMDAMEITQGGPDAHDDPHEMGAARTDARPLLVQKNHFRNYQKFQNFCLL